MSPAFYYNVSVNLIRKISNEQINFIRESKDFRNENPIEAREQAFNYYDSFVEVLLQGLGSTSTSDEEIRTQLRPFYKKDEHIGYIGIHMIADKNTYLEDLAIPLNSEEGFTIHCIPSNEMGSLDSMMFNLTSEFMIYEHFKYDTKHYKTNVQFFGDLDEYPWDLNPILKTYTILRTPFDWSKYKEPRHRKYEFEDHFFWSGFGDNISEDTNTPTSLDNNLIFDINSQNHVLDVIKRGEGKQIEFKRTLKYDIRAEAADKEKRVIIAKAICAFLNARGGYLLIGVTDDREILGLQYDYKLAPPEKDPRDYLKLDFDNLIRDVFPPQILHCIDSNIIQIGDKDIFIAIVYPSKNPIFMKVQNGKEFYVRTEASSRQINDIEEIVKYCFEHFINPIIELKA